MLTLPERAAEVAHLCSQVFSYREGLWRFLDASQPLSKLLKRVKIRTEDGKEEDSRLPPCNPQQ